MAITREKDGKKGAIVKIAAFFCIVCAWILLDQLTKSRFSGMEPSGVLAGPFLGLVDIRLVHNTGAAWGMFSDSTFALGVFSLVVCAVLAVYFFVTVKQANALTTVGFALVVAGGIGNAIDRFAQGYVTDFIEFSFVDFPVFNVADIGVTCGFAIIVIGMIVAWRTAAKHVGQDGR